MATTGGYVLGLDGGGTKTVALVARVDGTVVGVGRGGCGDLYADPSLAALDDAVGAALAQAGAGAEQLAAGGFGMAGADWPEDFEHLERHFRERGWGREVVVVNDAIAPLRAGVPANVGVAVVCGTGVAIGARSTDGRVWHTSFWQEVQGSRQLGSLALRAVYRAELGLDPPTALTGRVLALYGRASVEEVLHGFTARAVARPLSLDGLARALLDEAAAGDVVARGIVEGHGRGLGDYALVAAWKVGLEGAYPLVLAGGVLRHPSTVLTDAIIGRVREGSPGACPVRTPYEPVVGALLLGLEAAGVRLDEAVLARLGPSLPPAALFET